MILRRIALFLALTALSLTFLRCDLLGTESESEVVTSGVYVANAGGFRQGNSSLTIYDPSTQQIQRIPAEGPGFASYIQSLHLTANRFYLSFGETNAVGVFEVDTGEQVGGIARVRNPRYMATTESTAYVTGQDYSASPAPKLYQVNRSTNEVVDSVDVGGSPEDVAIRDGRVYVALGGQDGALAVVDPVSMTVSKTVAAECDNPRSLAVDQQEELLVFCAGSTIYNDDFEVIDRTDGAIRTLNASDEITTRVALDTMLTSASQGQRVFYSSQSDEAFAVLAGQSILRFDAGTNSVADRFSAAGAPIGALGYDATDQRLYIGRAARSNLFSAAGTVTIHRRDGTKVGTFGAGVAPTYIDFRRTEE